ncbi:MAG: enoyl-CoA hydratase/isomerase family protein [Gammaproteobacteria bacterium]|nr:enoyl-CoA hydratase/isomerase family protein [Gammaproteobacteria bacterium]MYD80498.1 enoyl-CoA hydratase/isomerase family protein [Gammaproteobacteria bacterium]
MHTHQVPYNLPVKESTSENLVIVNSYSNLLVEREGHVSVVTFNRPQKANALDRSHLEEIEAVSNLFRDDSETRVVVFTGAGKHFSSGADLSPDLDPIDQDAALVIRRRRARIGERAVQAILDIDQITVAAWNGAAMGGGACLATAMDFRIGAQDCFMQYPEIEIGVNLMWKSLALLVRIAGPSRTKRLVAGGERILASELLQWGILDQVVAPEDLLDTAMEWAHRYARLPPIPQQMIKQSVNAIANALDTAIMHMDVDQNMLTASTEDRREAIRSYLDKTNTDFKGD